MTNPTIDDVFELLDKWRHFPNYQLERRADIYFAMFLPDVLKARYGPCEIIPEFPLRHGTLGINETPRDENLSVKVDYAAFTKDPQAVYFVELKTDLASISDEQNCRLKKAEGMEFKELVTGVCKLRKRAKGQHKEKYDHLLNRLSGLCVLELAQKPEIVYILPSCNPSNKREKKLLKEVEEFADCIITFKEFADAVKGRGEIANRFALSLLEWAEVDAGSAPPGAKCP